MRNRRYAYGNFLRLLQCTKASWAFRKFAKKEQKIDVPIVYLIADMMGYVIHFMKFTLFNEIIK